jgi:hypothetical protein
MTGEFIGILVSCLLMSPAIPGYVLYGNPKKSNDEVGEGNKVFLKLYEQCLKMNTEACVGYKLLSASWGGLQSTTIVQSDGATGSEAGRQEMEENVDGVLLQKFMQSVTASSLWSPSGAAQKATRKCNTSFYLKYITGSV